MRVSARIFQALAAALILGQASAFADLPNPISNPAPMIEEQQSANNIGYPREALRCREEGDVRLSMCVGPDGTTRDVKIVQSSGSEALDKASIEGAKKGKLQPARDDAGNPIDWCDPPFEITIAWRLP